MTAKLTRYEARNFQKAAKHLARFLKSTYKLKD